MIDKTYSYSLFYKLNFIPGINKLRLFIFHGGTLAVEKGIL